MEVFNRFYIDRVLIFMVMLIAISFGSCVSEKKQIDYSKIKKDWTIVGGLRDGKKTTTLNGAYLNFGESTLKTNYFMKDVERPYAINESDHTIDIGNEESLLEVHYLTIDSMHLSTIINHTPFDFYLK